MVKGSIFGDKAELPYCFGTGIMQVRLAPPSQFVSCPYCHSRIRPTRIEGHCRRVHSSSYDKQAPNRRVADSMPKAGTQKMQKVRANR